MRVFLQASAAWPTYLPVARGAMYTLRDEMGRVQGEQMSSPGGATTSPPVVNTQARDNVYLGNLLVASNVISTLAGTLGYTYFHADHLGTPRIVTNPSKATVETWKYWPYGDEAQTSTTMQRIRFATMERDTEANKDYDHARNYEFNLGRFLTPDPLAIRSLGPQSWNRYAYASGNPVARIDPSGFADCGAGACPAPTLPNHYDGSITVNGGVPTINSGLWGLIFAAPGNIPLLPSGGGPGSGGGAPNTKGPCKGVGVFAQLGGSIEGGAGPLGAGAQGGVGAGGFLGHGHPSLGVFATGGAFAGGPGYGVSAPPADRANYPTGYANLALGVFAGAGPSIGFTNAGSAEALSGPFSTTSLNVGLPIASITIQLQVDPASGIFTFSGWLKPIGTGGVSASSYQTTTKSTSLAGGC